MPINNVLPPAGSSRFPTFRRVLSRRVLGRVAVGLAVLATVIALACAEESWRGRLAWQHYKRQLEAQGEKLDWKDFIPPPVPDDQNFAMTPFLAPLFDFNPEPRKEGQSIWRDTNSYQRTISLGEEVAKYRDRIGEGRANPTLQQRTDLEAWALALTGKLDQEQSAGMSSAAQEAFRRRYGLPPLPVPPPASTTNPEAPTLTGNSNQAVSAAEASAAQEVFARRYGLPPPAVPVPGVDQPPASPTNTAPALTRPEAAAEVLRALAKYDPVLEELRGASRRPYARFNIRYQGQFPPAILLPHLSVLNRVDLIFQLRASAELALGQADKAWVDTQMILYLAETLKDEPFLISKLVQHSLVQLALRPIWEGLAEHEWSDAQLVEIQQRLGKVDLLADAALRGERAMSLLTIEQLRRIGSLDPQDPRGNARFAAFLFGGFFYQNELLTARMYQQFFVPVVDAANQRIYPSRAAANEAALTEAMTGGFPPYRMLAELLLPGLTSTPIKLGFGQTRVNEAIVACALERYRLAQGQFPDSLEPLCPRFLDKMPHDIVTGAPLIYRRTPDGQFILYSVGWNEKDEGGKVALTKANWPSSNFTEGDWVWQYPPPAQQTARK